MSWTGLWGALTAALLLTTCTALVLDDQVLIRDQLESRVPTELRPHLTVPFELDERVQDEIDHRVSPAGSERARRDAILDFIFGYLDLQYSLTPTRDAPATFATAEGNCLSFVNLFVGIGRQRRLNPFFVEVEDYQRWNYQEGVVVSRGHIVAGMYIDGQLATFDFLPYQAKSYRKFKPISDLAASAHFYNNLGAEALLTNDLAAARRWLTIATALAPDFDKALNNLGVALLRAGELEEAIEAYRRGLRLHPDDVPMLSNLARTLQRSGQEEEARGVLDRLEQLDQASPFFYLYRGDQTLADGDPAGALRYMRRAFRLDSEIPEVHLGLVRVYLATGKLEEARHHVERALKLDATHEEARRYAGLIARPGRFD